jgi:glutamate 5-kinase
VDPESVGRLCAQVVELRALGHSVVIVSSGAIAAGWSAMGGGPRPTDPATLQAVSAVGQSKLMRVYDEAFAARATTVGQVLLAPLDFIHRQQYLHARQTLSRLLELGVVPVVNENDATSDDEIRFGDNDRLAALVAHLVAADLLVLLTDTVGLLTADPRTSAEASLIEEVVEIDHELEVVAGGAGSEVGSGGMASKLAAAKIAAWSGVETVIADAGRPGVLVGAIDQVPGVGTVFRPRGRRLPARKLWIAFAVAAAGTLVVDEGARRALVEREASLLPAGVVSVSGRFDVDDAVEIVGPDGVVFAKGLARHPAERVTAWAGRRTSELPDGADPEVVHRDDLVVLR